METLNNIVRKAEGRTNGTPKAKLEIPKVELESDKQFSEAMARIEENRIQREQILRTMASFGSNDANTDQRLREQAEASLRGEAITPVAYSRCQRDLAELDAARLVLVEAGNIIRKRRDEEKHIASVEVCRGLAPEQRTRLTKLARCALDLEAAMIDVLDMHRQIREAGYTVTEPILDFPFLWLNLGSSADQNSRLAAFLRTLRSKGIEV